MDRTRDQEERRASTSISNVSDHKVGHRADPRQQDPYRDAIGIDALQTAFSAKFYELANKCKNWEKYAAKLRAQLEVMEAENRVLQEQNNQLEAENVRLQADLRQSHSRRLSSPDNRLAPPAPTALQSKRRSTVSGDRGQSLSLAQIVKGALTASGVVVSDPGPVPSRPPSRPPSRAASRAASRLSTQSGVRSRSRTGSVQDAIPVAVEDVFCDQTTYKAHSTEGSPVASQLELSSHGANEEFRVASQRLVAATERMALVQKQQQQTNLSPQSDSSASSTQSHAGSMTFERKLYIRFQQELTQQEFFKFERYIQRYDFLDIPLEGPKGLITRVKRLLLVSDPDLRNKPDKLRVRQQLARDFDGMAKHFVQVQIPAAP